MVGPIPNGIFYGLRDEIKIKMRDFAVGLCLLGITISMADKQL